jgi:hypothetical protein
MPYSKLFLAAALVSAAAASSAQTPAASSAQTPGWQIQANEAEQARDFDRAIGLYREAAAQAQNPVPLLMQIGRLQRLAGQMDAAQATYENVLLRAPANPGPMLGMAIVETARRNLDGANGWIGRAVAAGLNPGVMEAQAALAPLRTTEAYRTHLAQADRQANPCRHQPEYSAFDFWIGDWDIYVGGTLAARNIITREMNGCIIHERYQRVNGFVRGESINYYNAQLRRWEQTWVAGSGNVIVYQGNSPREGVMELSGSAWSPGAPGVQLQRVVWARTAEAGLTQTVSVSNDNGQTWNPGFHGVYVRTNRTTPTRNPDDTYPYNDALSRPAGTAR